jgi:hypothetical protein
MVKAAMLLRLRATAESDPGIISHVRPTNAREWEPFTHLLLLLITLNRLESLLALFAATPPNHAETIR